MAFCSGCGAQLGSNERFCVKCGADQTTKAAVTPAAPTPAAFTPPPQAYTPPPQAYAPPPATPPAMPPYGSPGMPGQMPIIMGAPPQAPANNNNMLWGVIIVGAILYGLYYIGTHDQNQNQGTAPTGQTQPAPPGQGGGGGGNTQALVAAQQFLNPSYNAVNGYVQVSQAQWLNGSNTAIAAAGLGCEQLDANGQGLTQDQVTLTGPAQPGQTLSLPTFQIGAVAQGAAKVDCKITAVTPAN